NITPRHPTRAQCCGDAVEQSEILADSSRSQVSQGAITPIADIRSIFSQFRWISDIHCRPFPQRGEKETLKGFEGIRVGDCLLQSRNPLADGFLLHVVKLMRH